MAIGPWIPTAPRSKYLDFTVAFSRGSHGLVTPRPKPSTDYTSFIKPFSYEVWMLLVACIFGLGLLLIPLNYLIKSHLSIKQKKHLFFEASWIPRILLSDVIGETPFLNSGKLIVATWLISSFILTTSYSGLLVSLLAVPRIHAPVDSLEDLVEYGKFPYGVEKFTALYDQIMTSKSGVFAKAAKNLQGIPTCLSTFPLIAEENFALICDIRSLKKGMAIEFSENGTCSSYLAKEPIQSYPITFAFQKKSPIVAEFDLWLLRMDQAGMLSNNAQEGTMNSSICLRPLSKSESNALKPLSMSHIEGILLLAGIGYLIGFIAFLLEIATHYAHSRSSGHVSNLVHSVTPLR